MKTVLTLAVLGFSANTFGQVKPAAKDTAKPVYEKFYRVPPGVIDALLKQSHSLKDGLIYDPALSPDEKIKAQVNIAGFLNALPRYITLDSALVKRKKK